VQREKERETESDGETESALGRLACGARMSKVQSNLLKVLGELLLHGLELGTALLPVLHRPTCLHLLRECPHFGLELNRRAAILRRRERSAIAEEETLPEPEAAD
jgi:hypothetical protein